MTNYRIYTPIYVFNPPLCRQCMCSGTRRLKTAGSNFGPELRDLICMDLNIICFSKKTVLSMTCVSVLVDNGLDIKILESIIQILLNLMIIEIYLPTNRNCCL